ncbi:MAG: methylmalonyl-CoA mutase family protein [Kiritimatiellia bacterium]
MTNIPLSPVLNLHADFDKPDRTEWRSLTEAVLNGVPFEKKLVTQTLEGIALQPIVDRTELEENLLADTTPGAFPYVRGTRASGFRTQPWEICQALPYPTAAEFNEAIVHDVSRGQNSVRLQLDESGCTGNEPGEHAGQCGTHLQQVMDLVEALKGLDLENLTLHIESGAAAPAVAAALKQSGLVVGKGSLCMDPLAELMVRGSFPMDLAAVWKLQADFVIWMEKNLPGFRSVGVDVSGCVNAGGNAVTELAVMLGSAAESFRNLSDQGLDIDTIAQAAMVKLSIGSDTFMETAKFRAARALWAKLVESCGGNEESAKLYQSAAAASWHQTKLDPYVNLLRGTSQAFSAVLGGVDVLRVDPFDAPFGLPDTISRRIARNIQLVLLHETHLTEVVDPAGGSWTVENLTRELCGRAWTEFQDMEKAGGLMAMLQDGSLRSRLKEQADKQRTLLAQRRSIKVGTNQFSFPEEKKPAVRLPDSRAVAAEAWASLSELKRTRDQLVVDQALLKLGKAGTMPAIEDAVAAGALFSEVVSACSHGQCTRVNPVELGRLSTEYESLRERMEAHVAQNGKAPCVFMAQMGPVSQHKIRSDFSQEFLKPAGFVIEAEKSFTTAAEAAQAVIDAGAEATVICSTDATYPDLVPEFARAVKAGSPQTVVLMAGMLPDQLETFKQAGVDHFIHLKANNIDVLQDLQAMTGVAQ